MDNKTQSNDFEDSFQQEYAWESIAYFFKEVVHLAYVLFSVQSVVIVTQSEHDRINNNAGNNEAIEIRPSDKLNQLLAHDIFVGETEARGPTDILFLAMEFKFCSSFLLYLIFMRLKGLVGRIIIL